MSECLDALRFKLSETHWSTLCIIPSLMCYRTGPYLQTDSFLNVSVSCVKKNVRDGPAQPNLVW